MKQLVKHYILVTYYNADDTIAKAAQYNCADVNESRAVGREIAQWLVGGVGRQVVSTTTELEYR